MLIFFDLQVIAFNGNIGSKYMLELDVTSSNIDVSSDIRLYSMSLKLFQFSQLIMDLICFPVVSCRSFALG